MVEHAAHLDAVFQALADPTRRAMLRQLTRGERSVSELAEPFTMSLAGASKHVKVLERAGLVRRSVRGRTHLLRFEPRPLVGAEEWLRLHTAFWSERLDALETALAQPDGAP